MKIDMDSMRIDDVMSVLEATAHPRLYANEKMFAEMRRDALDGSGIRSRLYALLSRVADDLLDKPVNERILEGRRLLAVSWDVQLRVIILALCYKIGGKRAWLDRCVAELRAVSAFSDWNPSHFLDVADMTMGVAIGYDWLYNELSDEDRKAISTAILEKGLKSSEPDAWWRTTGNNWAQVCHAGMIAGSLAVAELDRDCCRRQMLESICNLERPMKVYAPHGSYPEGPDYWGFGTGRNICALMMLENAFGSDFGLSEMPGFRESAFFNEYLIGSSGKYFSYGDGYPSPRHLLWQLWWFAKHYNMPELLEFGERELLEALLAKPECSKVNELQGLNPLLFLLVFDKVDGLKMPELSLVWNPQGKIPIVVMRNGRDASKSVFIGLKGGTADSGHSHQDGGSFVLDAKGKRWFEDIGAEYYHRIESLGLNLWNNAQDSDRWKLFRYNNHGHNTLVIDGHPQLVQGFVSFLDVTDGPIKRAVMDMTSDYADVCTKALRTVTLADDGTVTITDELEGLMPGAEVLWGANTYADVELTGNHATLLKDGETITLANESGIGSLRITDCEQPQPFFRGDSPNPGLKRLELVTSAPANGKMLLKLEIK